MFRIKFCTMVKHSSAIGVLELSASLTSDLDLDQIRLTLFLICWQNGSFDSWLWNGFLQLALRIKPNNTTAVFFPFFFSRYYSKDDAIQGKPISHSSLRDSCDIGFRVQFNADLPRQVMNCPIEWRMGCDVRPHIDCSISILTCPFHFCIFGGSGANLYMQH